MSQAAIFTIMAAVILTCTVAGTVIGWRTSHWYFLSEKAEGAVMGGWAGLVVGYCLVLTGVGTWALAGVLT